MTGYKVMVNEIIITETGEIDMMCVEYTGEIHYSYKNALIELHRAKCNTSYYNAYLKEIDVDA